MRKKTVLLLVLGLFFFSVTDSNAILGVSSDTIKKGISDFTNDFVKNPAQSSMDVVTGQYLINVLAKGLANACFAGLVYVYNKIGTILIPIPDLADSRTYNGFAGGLVHNIYQIMVVMGIFVGLVVFIARVGMMASGLGGRELTVTAVTRLIVAMTLMVAWPTIYSFFNQMATSAGYLIFGQNTASVTDVLKGISNLDDETALQAQGTPASNGSTSASSSPEQALSGNMNNVLVVSKMLGMVLCLIGLMYGGYRFSTGDQNGLKITFGAILGVAFVIGAGHLAQYFLNQAQPLQPLANSTVGNPTTNLTLPSATAIDRGNILDQFNTQSSIWASILKVIVSLWGLFICIGVLLSKFFQVASLIVIFFLGPIFCGLTASPATEGIARQGFLLMLKYQLYSVIWAIALMVLYIIGSVNFGAESLGVGNLLSAFAILAGLQLVQNAEAFASLFTAGAGVSIGSARDTWSNFSKAMISGAIVGGFKGTGEVIAGTKHGMKPAQGAEKVGAVIGGIIGSAIPVLGTVAGAKGGRNLFRMGNALATAAAGPGGGAGPTGEGNDRFANAVGNLAGEQKAQRIASQGRTKGSGGGAAQSSPRPKSPPRRS